MLTKQCQFWGQTESGIFCQPLFGSSGVFEKTAGAPPFADWPTGDKLRDFIEKIPAGERKKAAYVLVNALGAGEFFGSNINADYFPWNALAHKGRDYGHETFLDAHAFQHHANKDPTRAFGQPVLSLLNPEMKRVELIIRLDREKARAEQADGIVTRIDNGEFPDVSMGCLPKYAKVLLKSGRSVAIEEIKKGDEVITHKGRSQKVISTMVRPHKGGIYTVKAYGMREPLVLTEEHPLWLARKEQMECRPSSRDLNKGRKQHVCTPTSYLEKKGCAGCSTRPSYKFDWVRADEAREGDYLVTPVPVFESSLKLSAHEARLLGYYLSEGHVCYGAKGLPRAVVFSTNITESDVHEELLRISSALGVEDKFNWWDAVERNGRYIVINDARLAQLCAEHCGTGAKEKVLSTQLMGVDTDTLKLFLGAYANGDGGAYKGSLYLSTASEELSEQLRLVLARCEMIASVNKIFHKPSKNSLVQKETIEFQVWIGTDTASRLTTSRLSLDSSLRQNSKRFFYEYEGTTYLMTPIETIEEAPYDDNVFNFEVEEDNSYVAEGLAVHNCKVPYDVCSICGNESKTRNDYCQDMRPPEEMRGIWGPNKILPDGRRIYVVNTLPRFFDISFVFIGADKTAKVMAKVASRGNQICLGDICTIPRPSVEVAHMIQVPASYGVEKTASADCECEKDCCKEKMAEFGIKSASEKLSEILKQVPLGKFTELSSREPSLPNLEEHAEELPLSVICSTAGAMGIPLKPQEFQTIVLTKMGHADWAQSLKESNSVFRQVGIVDDSVGLDMSAIDQKLASDLMSVVRYRTAFGEPFTLRKLGFEKSAQKILPTPNAVTHPLLDKISAAYNGYRQNLLLKISQAAAAVESDPQLRQAVNGRMLINMFAKTASIQTVDLDSVAYLAGAYMASSLFSNPAVTMAVAADRWLQSHISAQGF